MVAVCTQIVPLQLRGNSVQLDQAKAAQTMSYLRGLRAGRKAAALALADTSYALSQLPKYTEHCSIFMGFSVPRSFPY